MTCSAQRVYFYCRDNVNAYQDDVVVLAEGLRELGVEVFLATTITGDAQHCATTGSCATISPSGTAITKSSPYPMSGRVGSDQILPYMKYLSTGGALRPRCGVTAPLTSNCRLARVTATQGS